MKILLVKEGLGISEETIKRIEQTVEVLVCEVSCLSQDMMLLGPFALKNTYSDALDLQGHTDALAKLKSEAISQWAAPNLPETTENKEKLP